MLSNFYLKGYEFVICLSIIITLEPQYFAPFKQTREIDFQNNSTMKLHSKMSTLACKGQALTDTLNDVSECTRIFLERGRT